jgi:hypothetical protein
VLQRIEPPELYALGLLKGSSARMKENSLWCLVIDPYLIMFLHLSFKSIAFRPIKTSGLLVKISFQLPLPYCSTPFLNVSSSNAHHFLAFLRFALLSAGCRGENVVLLGLGNCGLCIGEREPSGSGESSHCKQAPFEQHVQNLMLLSYATKLSTY